ncbi:serpin-ZX-like [Tasmannia lanceolata]|uniref:serpin-ZX-like n=1 Tax=Tasmannia lanceolata TaxID=3420 RepID=UPI0040632FD5
MEFWFGTPNNSTAHTFSCLELAKYVGLSDVGKGSNFVFSPLSIHVALSLVASGSNGPTLDQILSFLGSENIDHLNSLSSLLIDSVHGSRIGGPRLSFVNGVWIDKTLTLRPNFMEIVNSVYRAKADSVDFQNKPDEVRKELNTWVEKDTNGLIKDLLPCGSVDDTAKLIFANALYFKGAWDEQFDRSKTKDSKFYLLDGSSIQVPFMTSKKDQFLSSFNGFKVFRLPYIRGEDQRHFSIYLFLPEKRDGLQDLIEKMCSDSGFLDNHLPHRRVEIGKLMIPRFKISFGFEASDVLKDMGLKLPFSEIEAELTEMIVGSSPIGNLHVSSVHHRSLVEVNEGGTEAAASTAILAVALCAFIRDEPPMDFVADHPFVFMIREDLSRVVLFMGHVLNPLSAD